jgi:hypothetical protein
MGLAPTSPLTVPPPVVVMAAPARMVKCAHEPKLTAGGPAACKAGRLIIVRASAASSGCFLGVVLRNWIGRLATEKYFIKITVVALIEFLHGV